MGIVMEKDANGYPQLSASNWWAVRQRFVQSMPTSVASTYLAAILPMTEQSASNNILRPLKRVGLVDQDNKPSERAYKWRDDAQYLEVCEEIRKEVYPQELVDAFPDFSSADRLAVERWFRNNARVGENAARKMARFYLLLLDADPSKQEGSASPKKATARSVNSRSAQSASKKQPSPPVEPRGQSNGSSAEALRLQEQPKPPAPGAGPSLHIDVQVHISSEASAEQIDAIFASMAKHLYRNDADSGA